MTGVLDYDSNNSGGSWWLKDEDWEALEAKGWNVHWAQKNPNYSLELLDKREKTGYRWLGALATGAAKKFDNKEEGLKEWQDITGEDPGAEGCNCCGPPHNFTWHDDDGSTGYGSIMVSSEFTW